MATVIRDDSLSNLTQSLQFLADARARDKSRSIQLAELLNRQGKNQEAEELIRKSQDSIFVSPFRGKAEEWKANRIFETPADIALKQVQDLQARQVAHGDVEAEQGGILAEIKANYTDPRTGKLNVADYNKQLETLGLGITGMTLMSKGSDTPANIAYNDKVTRKKLSSMVDPVFKTQRQAYKLLQGDQAVLDKETDKYNAPIIKANKEAEAYNRKAEAFNNNKPQYRSSYEGDEVDQNQQLIDDTMLAIENARSDSDKLKAYNKYYTTGKAISDHYGHKFDAQNPAFFGIGVKKGNGTGNKTDRYAITLANGKEVSVELPKGYDPDSEIGYKMARQKLRLKDGEGWNPGSWNPLSSDSTYLNPAEKIKMEGDKLAVSQAKDNLINSQIDARDGVFTRRSTAEKEYLDELAANGQTVVTDSYGYKRIVPLTNVTPASNGTELKHLDKFRVR